MTGVGRHTGSGRRSYRIETRAALPQPGAEAAVRRLTRRPRTQCRVAWEAPAMPGAVGAGVRTRRQTFLTAMRVRSRSRYVPPSLAVVRLAGRAGTTPARRRLGARRERRRWEGEGDGRRLDLRRCRRYGDAD
jgi:hypothetical protein